MEVIEKSGRPVSLLVIQKSGGTRATIEAGRHWVDQAIKSDRKNHRASRWRSPIW